MDQNAASLQGLLTGELPLDKVGPRLRDEARRALLGGDRRRMLVAARSVVGELLRRGELLRVAVESDDAREAGPFCLLRDSRRLIDLSALGSGVTVDLPEVGPQTGGRDTRAYDETSSMLKAMEDAQQLAIGAPESDDVGVAIDGIVTLLERYAPQFKLYVELHPDQEVPEDAQAVFGGSEDEDAPAWQSVRPRGHSVWIPDAGEFPAHVRKAAGEWAGDAGCAAVVPVWEPEDSESESGGREVGLLYVVADRDWGRDSMLRVGERLARFVTRRWQNQRDVNRRIHKDALTGVFNRGYFENLFRLELERARRSRVPLSLVLLDIDHFKRVNDTYGHTAGDRVLAMVARKLQEQLRRIDHVCRVGGEEFALVLPGTDHEAVREVVARLLDAEYSETTVPGKDETRIAVTLSLGALTIPESGGDPDRLYIMTDNMCYLSKDSGRNQCHIWSIDGEHEQILPTGAAG